MMMSPASLLLALCIVFLAGESYAVVTSDRVIYDIRTQAKCVQVRRGPSRNCVWPSGLNAFADQIVEGGRIVAYRIQWFNKRWSGWYVPGVNDMDWKFNLVPKVCRKLPARRNTLRRVWSYFYDHSHLFIICKP